MRLCARAAAFERRVLLSHSLFTPPRFADVPTIAAALEDSDELQLSEERDAVRRTRPLPSEDDSDERSVYVKGPFPAATTLEELEAFFSKSGGVKRLNMRRLRGKDKPFKGSVFVEFASVAEAQAFVAAAAAGTAVWPGLDKLARVETKQAYAQRKRKEFSEKREKRAAAGGSKGGSKGAKAPAASDATGAATADAASASTAAAPATLLSGRVFNKEIVHGVIVRISGLGPSASQEGLLTYLLATVAAPAAAAGDGSDAPAAVAEAPVAPDRKRGRDEHVRRSVVKFVDVDAATATAHVRFEDAASAAAAAAELSRTGNANAARAMGAEDAVAVVLR